MSKRAIDMYLNDHLAGATAGSELAEQIRDRHQGEELGDVMKSVAEEVENDRKTLLGVMERMGTVQNPVKQATGWVVEKLSRVKFAGVLSGDPDHGSYMALESLYLGVEGKASMWRGLMEVADQYPSLATTDLGQLIERAESQKEILKREQLAVGRKVLAADPPPERTNPYSADNPPTEPVFH